MSPFGVKKEEGGDSPANTKFIEECKGSITGTNKRTGKPYTESEKIAICKAQLSRQKAKASILDPRENLIFSAIDGDLMDVTNNFMNQCMNKMIRSGKVTTSEDAKVMCERELEMNNHDVEAAMKKLNRDIRTD